MGVGKFYKNLRLKYQLMLLMLVIIVIPIVVISSVVYVLSKNEIVSQIESSLKEQSSIITQNISNVNYFNKEKLKGDLNIIRDMMNAKGSPEISVDNNLILAGKGQTQYEKDDNGKILNVKVAEGEKYILNNNFEICDKIFSLTGDTCSIFQLKDFAGENKDDAASIGWNAKQAFYRISTNVEKQDGSRALGTIIGRDAFNELLNSESYYGNVSVSGTGYLAIYEPIKDLNGKIVGALAIGAKEQDILDTTKTALASRVIGKNGYVWIVDENGLFVLSKKRGMDGENVLNYSEGGANFKNILDMSKTMNEGEIAMVNYKFKDKDEPYQNDKKAAIVYQPDRKWTIGASIPTSDYAGNLNRLLYIIIGISLASLAFGFIVVSFFSNYFVNLFVTLERQFNSIDQGDLNIRIDKSLVDNNSEIGKLARSFYKMVDSLKAIITTIKSNISTTAASAEQLSTSAQQVNASMQQFSSTIEVVAKGASRVSSGAQEVQEISSKTSESAEKGGRSTQTVKDKMSSINVTTKEGADKMKILGERSNKISDIVNTISGISEQTNLLALNAAIEAARAGEAGRGFAVVADEVRKLAEESRTATEQIAVLIEDIKKEIISSVETMDRNYVQVTEGNQSIQEALKSFETIPVLVDNVSQSLTKMVASAEENATGANLLNSSVQQVTSAMQQVSSAAQQLSANAEELSRLSNRFKVDSGAASPAPAAN